MVVGVGALAWMVYRLGPATLLGGMRAVGWGFVLTCSAHLCGLLCDSVVLKVCAGKPAVRVPYLHFARTSIAGHGVSEASPFGKVGEVVKYALLDEKLRKADSAAALVAQNIASFVVNCGLIVLVTPLTFFLFDVEPLITLAFAIVGVVFLCAGAAGLMILRKGVGAWPFKVLRRVGFGRFRVSEKRIKRWHRGWRKVEKSWKAATARRGALPMIWGFTILSRLCNVLEAGLLVHFLGGDHAVAAAFLSLASYQVTGWVFTFVPMQVGTAEGAAFMMFRAVGLSPDVGIMVEIGRKLRRVVFMFVGIAVLGLDTFRRMLGMQDERKPDDDDDDDDEKKPPPDQSGRAA